MFGASSVDSSSIDPTSSSGTAKAKLDQDLNQFLNLLVTQLKNQDPLDPMDANEFTSQLVQFASVEQQIYQNANLEKLLNVTQTSQVAGMTDFIGNTIESVGSSFHLENDNAEITYQFDTKPRTANISIVNSSGLTVYSTDAALETDKQSFTWDGKNKSGTAQPDGSYAAIVSATDGDGNIMNVTQTVFGRVTGAGAKDGVVSLYMNDVITPLDTVLAVKETKTTPAP
ncbi:MAG: flagellar biosynthesis protein FlgD [Rhodospirillaceae bacterium]|jgi:flagellar basal-body rod modification protein FlgD|nr:flagellar biosynthesis protein FlgD [Rhodospirillaceae bacterium]MBT5245573.1 flagellar biosynthesis protein FlgD [Rhodospirillaceae bacterium]MBT5561055.1 flagellar biosynthesis protein FlgD [Rhodospirillaceae bacterium]